MIFADGVPLDEYFETTEGPFWVTGKVRIISDQVFLAELLIYPMTGSAVQVGVAQLFSIARVLKQAMKAQGLRRYSLSASRRHSGKSRRIISLTGRLR